MTESELGWAAGIVDAEASVAVYSCGHHGTKHQQYALRLRVTNTDPRMLRRLVEMFGGSIRPARNKSRGKWQWALHSAAAIEPLKAVLPYLVCKRDQVELALEFGATIDRNGGHTEETRKRREEIRQEIRVLKHVDHKEAM